MFRFLLIFIFVSASVLSLEGQNAKQYIKAGEQFLSNGMVEAALEEFDKAITVEPTNGRSYQLKASVQFDSGDSLLAAKNYQKSAALGYMPDENYFKAADIYYTKGVLVGAKECMEKGLAIKAKSFDLLLLKTRILYDEGKFEQAYQVADEAIKAKDMAIAYYFKGASAHRASKIDEAIKALEKAIIRDNNLAQAYLELADIQIEQGKYDYAVDNCSMVLLLIDPENIQALLTRSIAFHYMKESEQAIEDITKAISIDKNNWKLYMQRGRYKFDYALYTDAADDFTLALGINDTLENAYHLRGEAFEKLAKSREALSDYKTYAGFLEQNSGADSALKVIQSKIYELGTEKNKPQILLAENLLNDKEEIKVKELEKSIVVEGTIQEESALKALKINNELVEVKKLDNDTYGFNIELPSKDLDYVTITANDTYNNITTKSYPVTHIETEAPVIALISPLAADDHVIHLEPGDNTLYIEGRIEDHSTIREIKIDEVNASFAPGDYNPRFTATIDIQNRNKVTITAVDAFGNKQNQVYEFSKDGQLLTENNPMGKTWVVIIENSEYQQFTNLSNTSKDVYQLKDALMRYKISKVLHKKNMTKKEMERFFALDLRDLIVSNNVNSLLIWYAGHGKNISNTGYWIPNDGRVNDEYTYYNVNALKASLYSYTSLTHVLVVSDACEAGEGFAVAMRGDNSLASCNDLQLISQKSALVLTSSSNEAAMDNSLFAQTFANALSNNPANCIPIDAIAERISIVMYKHTAQVPKFGRISGLEDKNGTFFFITK